MEVYIETVGVIGSVSEANIFIKKAKPILEKHEEYIVTINSRWINDDIVAMSSPLMPKEELFRLEHFLAEKVQSFSRKNAEEKDKKKKEKVKKLKWVYVILWICISYLAFGLWYFLYCYG
jgi:hypothetical protein